MCRFIFTFGVYIVIYISNYISNYISVYMPLHLVIFFGICLYLFPSLVYIASKHLEVKWTWLNSKIHYERCIRSSSIPWSIPLNIPSKSSKYLPFPFLGPALAAVITRRIADIGLVQSGVGLSELAISMGIAAISHRILDLGAPCFQTKPYKAIIHIHS